MNAFDIGDLRQRAVALLLVGLAGVAPRVNATQLVGDAGISRNGNVATVHWATDIATGTRLKISPNAIVRLPADRTPTTDHVVVIEGLQPGKAYMMQFGTARLWLGTHDLSPNDGKAPPASPTSVASPRVVQVATAPPTEKSWGNIPSLPDHFARHGSDFHARNQDDYARMAWEFLQRAKSDSLPAKVDETGTLRVFDPRSGAFAAYNRNGTTKTFFKPGSPGYFDRQPGRPVNLKTWR